jgi:hypothetical protein
MTAKIKEKAIAALEGMAQIARHEMLTQGSYIDTEVSNPRLAKAGAICGGRKHCAIGSLWTGYGVPLKWIGSYVFLPGVVEAERADFMRNRPALRAAYDALNAAAVSFADRRSLHLDSQWESAAEALFEGHYQVDVDKRDMLRVIASAKRRVRNAT